MVIYMKALISPNETVQTGVRVAAVADVDFEVCLPMHWVDCPANITADAFWYDPTTSTFNAVVIPAPTVVDKVATKPQPTVTGATTLSSTTGA